MKHKQKIILAILTTLLLTAACILTPSINKTAIPQVSITQAAAPEVSNEGVQKITGSFTYSNDFVLETYYVEQAVALADMTGFVLRDKEWETPTKSQYLGFMQVDAANNSGTFFLDLPVVPEGTLNDVDQNGKQDKGVQIFAVSYWPNLTGGPYAEGDDPTFGWPTYLASVKTDSENQDEVNGGKLVIWSPDNQQQFPNGYGDDGLLFTKDDPVATVPAGYSVIDLDAKPFQIIRDSQPELTIYEPTDLAVKDYSADSYTVAFKKMFDVISKEYAFTDIPGKSPDWPTLYQKIEPMVNEAEANKDPVAFYKALQQFTFAFKDGHVGVSGGDAENQVFSNVISSGYGMTLRVLDNQDVIVTFVTPTGPADRAGIPVGTQIVSMNGEPIQSAIAKVEPLSGPFSTDFSKIYQQARYLMRAPVGTTSEFAVVLPNGTKKSIKVTAAMERESYSRSSVFYGSDPNALPVEFKILDSGVGYVKINSNYDDLNLIIRLFQRAMITFTNNQVPGIVIDMRQNSGGSPLGLAGFLYDQEIPMGQLEYFSDKTGKFEPEGPREKVRPNVEQYSFPKMALLVGQACASACEIEAYGFSQVPGMLVFGETPSAGVEAEVARGQFNLPEGFALQVPTGRFKLPDGSLFLEGQGVKPTNPVPVTAENVLSGTDYVLLAAENEVSKPAGSGIVPANPPVFAPVSDASNVLLSDTSKFFEDAANEYYANPYQNGENYTYSVAANGSDNLIWAFGWCAVDQSTLDKNFKLITTSFALEGKPVVADQVSSFDYQNQQGEFCRLSYLALTNWSAGEHHLSTNVSFTAPIKTGSAEYPKSKFQYSYTVYVAP